MFINYMGDFESAKKKIIGEQERRQAHEKENLKKMKILTRKYELLSSTVEKLSEKQKARLNRVPRTSEEWEIFNKDSENLEQYEKRLDTMFLELNDVIASLPFSEDDLKKLWQEEAKNIFKKYHMDN